jgi:chromatin remodeling complex protein RSC6
MKRGKYNHESLISELDKLVGIVKARNEGPNPQVQDKACTAILKQIEQVRKHSQNNKQPRAKSNVNSGLQKPVKIAPEMAVFAGWKEGDLHSRVDVTKVICKYIKDHDLQNPENRREILLDKKLKDILKFEDRAITYPKIQQNLAHVFIRDEDEDKEKVEKVKVEKVVKEKAIKEKVEKVKEPKAPKEKVPKEPKKAKKPANEE